MQTFPQYLAPGATPDRMSQAEKTLKRLQQSSSVAAGIICSDILEASRKWAALPSDAKAKAAKGLEVDADSVSEFAEALIASCKPKPSTKPKQDK